MARDRSTRSAPTATSRSVTPRVAASRSAGPGGAARHPRRRRLSLQAISRAISWHRRKLAVLAAVAAALTGINAALPPATPTVPVVSAASHLDGGRVLTAVDLKLVRVPEQLVPQGALTDLTTAIGRSVRAPVPRGQLLSDLSVISPSRSVRSGRVVAPLRLADGDVAALLTVGDVVDVLAADSDTRKAAVVASGVRVVGLPSLAADPGGGGALSGAGAAANSSSMSGALVLVEVDSRTATLLAQAAVTSTLSVVLR